MNRRTSQTSVAGLALGILWVYMVLALVAPGCSFAHATPSDSHHQHSGTESHSTLCSWACQATSDVGPISQGDVGTAWVAQSHTLITPPLLLTSGDLSSLHARAVYRSRVPPCPGVRPELFHLRTLSLRMGLPSDPGPPGSAGAFPVTSAAGSHDGTVKC